MILDLHLQGKLTSKRAAHVPVIRKWKLVWERREFGTQVDKIDYTFPLDFTDSLKAGEQEVIAIKMTDKLEVRVKVNLNDFPPQYVEFRLFYDGIYIPFSYTKKLPKSDAGNSPTIIAIHNEIYKGVRLDVEGTISRRS